jgi:5' nucleotidase, deoxy (Pyrimidine), cytosolic type C protein (NT5C)
MSPPPPERKVIAIDLDDTLSYTNLTICKWHNEKYGTNMTLDDFHSYYYWKNPGWGTPSEAISKVEDFLLSPTVNEIPPIPSAQKATKHLKEAGYTLVVITARMHEISDNTVQWLETHFPGVFDTVYFTSAFQSNPDEKPHMVTEVDGPPAHKHTNSHPTNPRGHHLPAYSVSRKKSDVCVHVGAVLLVDDAIENAFDVHQNASDVECFVFGDWKWNLTFHRMDREEDLLSYEQAKERGMAPDSTEPTPLPKGMKRTKTWEDVLENIKNL